MLRTHGSPIFRSGSRSDARSGFTLIELLTVILIIGVLAAFLLPQIPAAIDRAEVTACEKNLHGIFEALVIHESKYGDLPQESGARFVAAPITRKVWENTKANAKRLTCPGVKASALASISGIDGEQWFADKENVDGQSTSYAGRNLAEFPMRKFPGSGKDPLVADDNDGGNNHSTETLVLYADGSVGRFDTVTLEESGELGPDELLIVGEESQLEVLRKLTLD